MIRLIKKLFSFLKSHYRDGALGRTRTGTGLKPADFESAASTNFATRAGNLARLLYYACL